MKSKLVLAMMGVGFCGPVLADAVGPYGYASVGKALAHIDQAGLDSQLAASHGGAHVTSFVKDDPMAYKLNLGYQLTSTLGVEVGYGRMSSFRYSATAPISARASGESRFWEVVSAANFDVGAGFALTFRGGVANVHVTSSGTIANVSGSKTEVTGGAGIKYSLGSNVSVRADWDGFTGPGRARIGQINLISVGIGYNF